MKLDARGRIIILFSLILSGIGLGLFFYIQHQLNHIQGLLYEPQVEPVNTQIHRTLFVLGLGFLATAFLMGWVTRQLMAQTIQELLETAKEMLEGRALRHDILRRKDKLGSIARALRKMADEFEDLLDTLTHERDQFRAVLHGMDQGVIGLDGSNQITLFNRSARSLLNLTDVPIDRPFVEVVREPAIVNLIRNASGDESTSIEFELGGPIPRTLLARLTPQRTTDGRVLVIQDVTEIRRLANSRQDFVANVSHELRTPVSIIQGSAENLADGALEDAQDALRFTETILRNSKRLSILIRDLLELSKLDSGTLPLESTPVKLRILAESIIENFQSRTSVKRIAMDVDIDPSHVVLADSQAIEQVLTNLVDNATKYGASPGRILLRSKAINKMIQIQVIDDGPGIAPSHRIRIFERFYRVDPGRSRTDGGTGLGLSIVKNLVLAMKGDIWVEEASGGGSNFVFQLPQHLSFET